MKKRYILGIVILLAIFMFAAVGFGGTANKPILTTLLTKSPTVAAGHGYTIGYTPGQPYEPLLTWSSDKPIEIIGVEVMLDVDPAIGSMNADVFCKGRITQRIGGGRSAMTVEISKNPAMRAKNGAFYIGRVSVVAINDVNKKGELFHNIYGLNVENDSVFFPTGYVVYLYPGESIYVHVDAVNGAMSKLAMYATVKIIFYYSEL